MIGLIRRRIMGGMSMDKYLIKTVTLDSSHESDFTGNPVYWSQFLELPLLSDTSDRNLYMVVFEGNQATLSYRGDFEIFFRQTTDLQVKSIGFRNNRTSMTSAYSTSWSFWASAGTVIKVYKIPAV